MRSVSISEIAILETSTTVCKTVSTTSRNMIRNKLAVLVRFLVYQYSVAVNCLVLYFQSMPPIFCLTFLLVQLLRTLSRFLIPIL